LRHHDPIAADIRRQVKDDFGRCAFAARRGTIMEHGPLSGRSILVVEESPFVAHCLQLLLVDAGAQVHGAARSSEALSVIDRTRLSAAVLHDGKGVKGYRRIAQRLARHGLPCVLCTDLAADDEVWRGATVLFKPVWGVELVETVRRLVNAEENKRAPETGAGLLAASRVDLTETAT
jgi:DNA-binding response OmpR family regulator